MQEECTYIGWRAGNCAWHLRRFFKSPGERTFNFCAFLSCRIFEAKKINYQCFHIENVCVRFSVKQFINITLFCIISITSSKLLASLLLELDFGTCLFPRIVRLS